VDRVAADFGDVAKALRTIFFSDEFQEARGKKLKRPTQLVCSALRATGADTHAHEDLTGALARLGQPLYAWPTPDGFPDRGEAWIGTLLWRWNFAFALAANELPNVRVPKEDLARALGDPKNVFPHFVGRLPNDVEKQLLAAADPDDVMALVIASPAFQRC
jgi:uncharacterized protein (DUF1800 family)